MKKILAIGIIIFIFLTLFIVETVALLTKFKLWISLLITLGTFITAFLLVGLIMLAVHLLVD